MPLDAFVFDHAIRCPDCGHEYMHHERVEIFERGEDDMVRMTVVAGSEYPTSRMVPNKADG